jgi:hypothetical protein
MRVAIRKTSTPFQSVLAIVLEETTLDGVVPIQTLHNFAAWDLSKARDFARLQAGVRGVELHDATL